MTEKSTMRVGFGQDRGELTLDVICDDYETAWDWAKKWLNTTMQSFDEGAGACSDVATLAAYENYRKTGNFHIEVRTTAGIRLPDGAPEIVQAPRR